MYMISSAQTQAADKLDLKKKKKNIYERVLIDPGLKKTLGSFVFTFT